MVSSHDIAIASRATPSSRRVFSWALWDWGTQPFATVVSTFVFSVYLTSPAFGDKDEMTMRLTWATGIAGCIIALLAPALGQGTDRRGTRMFHLRWQTWALALVCAAMYFVAPTPEHFLLGAVLLGVGNVMAEISNVNYYAAIEEVSTPSNIGKVSGLGWGFGYLGGIAILLLIIGMTGTGFTAEDVRVSMLVCGAWILVFTIPLFISLKDRPRSETVPRLGILGSYRALGQSVRSLWHQSPNTVVFLGAAALFRDGLAGVFAFGGVLAKGTFGFTSGEVVLFGVAANIIAGLATMAFGLLDDRFGPKKVVVASLTALVLLGLGVFVWHDGGAPVFWGFGLGMCLFVGPAQSASRSLLTRLVPRGKGGELFGLYATTGRAVSFLAPLMFGATIALGSAILGPGASTQHWGILGVVAILAAGLGAMVFVQDPVRARTT